jgi:hypothetical protein
MRKSQGLEPVLNGKWYAMFEDQGVDCIAYGGFDTEAEAKAMFGERVSYAMFIPDDKLDFFPDYRKDSISSEIENLDKSLRQLGFIVD